MIAPADGGHRADMITTEQAHDLVGATAYSKDGEELGKITEWVTDERTGLPGFVAFSSGLLGGTTWVPVLQATFNSLRLTVPYSEEQVKAAPSASSRDGRLDADEERALREHFGVDGEYAG